VKLRLPATKIETLSKDYENSLNERDHALTKALTDEIFPSYLANRFLTKNEFVTVCSWKTPRSKPLCESNDGELIKEISSIALTTPSEKLKIKIWTLLVGVRWPTASVFLHFAFPDRYPILDFRALWSLGVQVPNQYTFDFWWEYTLHCRSIAKEYGVSMRVLDQALWQYSKLNQN
jgi:hypothetical protein